MPSGDTNNRLAAACTIEHKTIKKMVAAYFKLSKSSKFYLLKKEWRLNKTNSSSVFYQKSTESDMFNPLRETVNFGGDLCQNSWIYLTYFGK